MAARYPRTTKNSCSTPRNYTLPDPYCTKRISGTYFSVAILGQWGLWCVDAVESELCLRLSLQMISKVTHALLRNKRLSSTKKDGTCYSPMERFRAILASSEPSTRLLAYNAQLGSR